MKEYKVIPHAHMSAFFPQNSPPPHASGAKNAGVPIIFRRRMSFPSNISEVPKSAILRTLFLEIRRFWMKISKFDVESVELPLV
jgi:hypothetical protein